MVVIEIMKLLMILMLVLIVFTLANLFQSAKQRTKQDTLVFIILAIYSLTTLIILARMQPF